MQGEPSKITGQRSVRSSRDFSSFLLFFSSSRRRAACSPPAGTRHACLQPGIERPCRAAPCRAVPALTSLPFPSWAATAAGAGSLPARTCKKTRSVLPGPSLPGEEAYPPPSPQDRQPRWDGSPAPRASLQIDFSAGLLAGAGWQPAEEFTRLFKGFSCSAPGLLESPEEGLLSQPCLS